MSAPATSADGTPITDGQYWATGHGANYDDRAYEVTVKGDRVTWPGSVLESNGFDSVKRWGLRIEY